MRAKFFLIVFLFPVAVIAAGSGDDICVSGILYDANESMAIVNGTLIKENDIVEGVKISKINAYGVEFVYNEETFTKNVGQGCKVIKPKNKKKVKKISKIFQADEEGFFSDYGKDLYKQAYNNFKEANRAFDNASITKAYIYYAKATKYAQGAMALVTADKRSEMVDIVYAARKKKERLAKKGDKMENFEK